MKSVDVSPEVRQVQRCATALEPRARNPPKRGVWLQQISLVKDKKDPFAW